LGSFYIGYLAGVIHIGSNSKLLWGKGLIRTDPIPLLITRQSRGIVAWHTGQVWVEMSCRCWPSASTDLIFRDGDALWNMYPTLVPSPCKIPDTAREG
jgi:hypothetical protein